ncbi:MAG: hypothetical protein M1814_004450 [Vezdaea aestivalis]|nr:MAG: hypothetical protein M1814_004450 [Vezdaea aestivalis]
MALNPSRKGSQKSSPSTSPPLSGGQEDVVTLTDISVQQHHHKHLRSHSHTHSKQRDSDSTSIDPSIDSIALSAPDFHTDMTVTPFLIEHVPSQYAPQGPTEEDLPVSRDSNTKYCYRHRPDLKCRRQANEPSMAQLQGQLQTLSHRDQQAISQVWSVFSAAPARQRDLMLGGILASCCFPQLSYLSASVRELIRIDFLSALPTEVSYNILCFLDTTSLCKAAQVSQRWRSLADDDEVWHRMCAQHIDRKCTKCGWGLPLLEQKRLRSCKRQSQLRASGRGLNEWSPQLSPAPEIHQDDFPSADTSSQPEILALSFNRKRAVSSDMSTGSGSPQSKKSRRDDVELKRRPWKDIYKDRFRIGSNWKHGRCTTKVLRGHTNGVMCLQLNDSILATGSYDNTIKIWDIETGECIRTLEGHIRGIRSLQFDDTKLVSGSMDQTLKIWNWRTGDCIATYNGHTGGVVGVHFAGRLVASGSTDTTIKVWNFKTNGTFRMKGHTDWVNAVRIDNDSRTLFSASDDTTIRLWDLESGKSVHVFKGHTGQVQQLVLLPNEFELNFDASQVTNEEGVPSPAPSAETHSPSPDSAEQHKKDILSDFPDSRPRPPRYILTSALDSTIRLWDTQTGACLRTFFGHIEGVWGLAADTLRAVSGSEDRTLKIWDPRSGHCDRTFAGHSGPVTCVGLSDSRMISGGEDGEVRIYDFGFEDGDTAGTAGV